MFDLTFLGTSAASPSAYRGLSAHIINHRQYRFLLDCGEGTQRQILKSGAGFRRLDKVLLTHSHLDHIMGLGGLVSTLARWEVMEQFEIYGSQSTLDRVSDLVFGVALRGNRTAAEVKLHEIKPGMVIVEDGKFKLTAFPVKHRGPGCYGFLFEEKTRRPFLDEKAKALNVPFGPERAKLVQGETITLADGRMIGPDDVLGDEIKGTKYVHIGDLAETKGLEEICAGADALVVEATYTEEEAEMAKAYGHLTAAQGARFAKEVGVKTLILTHISRRHTGRQIGKEAGSIFKNMYVARDFDRFEISQGKVERFRDEGARGE
ncbi:MAG: ribonuclease Z [Cellvibrionaceae bacterium]|jgi:ribonuclease Z